MRYFFLVCIFLIKGCYTKDIYVYEKIPEEIECYRFKEYQEIDICNRKYNIITSEKISKVIKKKHSRRLTKLSK